VPYPQFPVPSRVLAFVVTIGLVSAFGITRPATAAPGAPAPATPLSAHGSVEQVYVTDARSSQVIDLLDARGARVARGRADRAGSVLFRNVRPGPHRVEARGSRSIAVEVLAPDAAPPAPFYSGQHLGSGFQYLTTRDGTTLAIDVRLPGPVDGGPYPTVVEYSGYDAANPDDEQPASRIASALGFATVGVNMRGTGCSGGAWSYFEPLQSLDGYDAVETVAAQPWVLGHRVGMVGISYPGITQLFVAATQPPHLAAITPLSVIDDTYRGVLYPGGILNTGFAVPWARDRQHDARPAPGGGQDWARRRIEHGDPVCKANQALRLQTPNVAKVIAAYGATGPAANDPLAPISFVNRIRVPTFLAGTWQDEQTGGHWAEMLSKVPASVPLKVTLTNGSHADSLVTPAILGRWIEFLDLYVAGRIPSLSPTDRSLAAAFYGQVGAAGLELPPDRFTGETSYAAARARYEGEPRIRVLFDAGAGAKPGRPVPGFEQSFDRWPVPGLTPSTWYLAPGGRLDSATPTARARSHVATFRSDPSATPRTDAPAHSGNDIGALPAYRWKMPPTGRYLSWVSPPLSQRLVLLGSGSVDLWVRATAPDTDFQVTLTEVRPDGKETYVQSGWLRGSRRKLDPARSTMLDPVPTFRPRDASALPAGKFTLVRIPLFPVGHAFRAGSRLRIIVQAPGGSLPLWSFDALGAHTKILDTVAFSAAYPSRVVLSSVPGIAVPTPLPPCPALRGQPCRTAVGVPQQ
jgi:predicted acyl esterase